MLSLLLARLQVDPFITYYAVDKNGILKTNVEDDTPNAVTWGVFPGKEIVQPTIVEALSFMAWKDEAFQLWVEWSKVYDVNATSAKLLQTIADTWYLVNIVHNDFQNAEALFLILNDLSSEMHDDIFDR